jgi:hypothetical protein
LGLNFDEIVASLGNAVLLRSTRAQCFFFRWAVVGRIAPILLFSGFLLLPLSAEAGLPRAAISIPTDQNLTAGLRAAEQCELPSKLIVLPPLSFNFGEWRKARQLFRELLRSANRPERARRIRSLAACGGGSRFSCW